MQSYDLKTSECWTMFHDEFHDESVHFENKLEIPAKVFYSLQHGSIVLAAALNRISTSFPYPAISGVSKLWAISFIYMLYTDIHTIYTCSWFNNFYFFNFRHPLLTIFQQINVWELLPVTSSRIFCNSDTIRENSIEIDQTNSSDMELISFVLSPSRSIKVYTNVVFNFLLNCTPIRCK